MQSSDYRVTGTDADSGKEIQVLTKWKNRDFPHATAWIATAWHPDGNILATSRFTRNLIQLWEMPSAKNIAQFRGGSSYANSLAWSPDGRLLAVSNSDKTLRLYDHQLGRFVLAVREAGLTDKVAWDDSGTRLAYKVVGVKVSPAVKVLDAGRGYLAENSPKALPWIDQHIAAEPDHVGHRYRRANLLEALGRPNEARAEWQRLAKLRPDDPDFAARSRGGTWTPPTLNAQPAQAGQKDPQAASTSVKQPTAKTSGIQPADEAAAKRVQRWTRLLESMDKDGDQKADWEEYLALFVDLFNTWDQHKDGTLSGNELPQSELQNMDADGDGKVTREENQKLREKHFRQLDKNGDGFWTKDEIQ